MSDGSCCRENAVGLPRPDSAAFCAFNATVEWEGQLVYWYHCPACLNYYFDMQQRPRLFWTDDHLYAVRFDVASLAPGPQPASLFDLPKSCDPSIKCKGFVSSPSLICAKPPPPLSPPLLPTSLMPTAANCLPNACDPLQSITVPTACPSIQAAVNCVPATGRAIKQRVTIHVLPGEYREQVVVNKSAVTIIGASAERVTIRCSVSSAATLNVTADDLILENITVLNDANHYSVGKNFALWNVGDRVAFIRSAFFGSQDTIYTGAHRAYFGGCTINGTSDFLYGQGSAVWDACTLLGEPGSKGWSFVTAHSGNNSVASGGCDKPNARGAYLVRNSRLPRPASARLGATWLGRPWGPCANVVFSNVWMDDHINDAGWAPYHDGCKRNDTRCGDIFYAEFNSSGPGAASPDRRVRWSRQLTAGEAAEWTPRRVLGGWEPPSLHSALGV